MTRFSGQMDDFGLYADTLPGPLDVRLQAARQAGFGQVVLSAADLVAYPHGLEAGVALVRASGLRVTALHALRDYEGLGGAEHAFKVDVAKSLMALCQTLNCRQLLVQATTLAQASADPQWLCRDLRQLALLAIPKRIRIAYGAVPGAQVVTDYLQAWELICQVDLPNLGLFLDVAQLPDVTDQLLEDLDMLDPIKLFLVQLSDGPVLPVFPGEGAHGSALAAVLTRLHALGYRGDYGLGVRNSDYLQMPVSDVAMRARRSAQWLGESVLQRSVPLPNHIRLRRRNTP